MVKRVVALVKGMSVAVKLIAAKIKNTVVGGAQMVDPLLTMGIHGIAIDGVGKALSVVGMGAVTASMFIVDPFYLNLATWGAFALFFMGFFRGLRASVREQGRALASS